MLQRVLSQWSWAQLGFFRAGEVPWNKGTSINILSTTHERLSCRENFRRVLMPDTPSILNEKFDPQMNRAGVH